MKNGHLSITSSKPIAIVRRFSFSKLTGLFDNRTQQRLLNNSTCQSKCIHSFLYNCFSTYCIVCSYDVLEICMIASMSEIWLKYPYLKVNITDSIITQTMKPKLRVVNYNRDKW